MKKFLLIILCIAVAAGVNAQTDSLERHKAARIITSTAGSIAINGGLTELLKNNVHKMRPDREDNHSFPSRHTSWAFTGSTILSNELYRYSPFFSMGGQLAATMIGAQRVIKERHYPSDVLSGALLGVASTEFTYFLCRKIFGGANPFSGKYTNDFRGCVGFSTTGMFYLHKNQACGYAAGVWGGYPVNELLGFTLESQWIWTPSYTSSPFYPKAYNVISSYGLLTGPWLHITLPGRSWAFEGNAKIGVIRNEDFSEWFEEGWFLQSGVEAGISYRFTRKFSCRASVGYSYINMSTGMSAITAGVSSIAVF